LLSLLHGHVAPAHHVQQEAVDARGERNQQAFDVLGVARGLRHAFHTVKRPWGRIIASGRAVHPPRRRIAAGAFRRPLIDVPAAAGYNGRMRVLGLDLGERRVGVAISDSEGTIASPLGEFKPRGRSEIVETVRRLVAEHDVGRVVVGLPLLEDGLRGEQARRAEGVAEALREALDVPVETWDERYSTIEADRLLREAGRTRRQRRGRRDRAAAAVILQSYLEATRR